MRTDNGRYLLGACVEDRGVVIVPFEVVLLFKLDKGRLWWAPGAPEGEKLSLRDTRLKELKERGETKCFRIEDVKEGARDMASEAGAGDADSELAQLARFSLSLSCIHLRCII